MPLSMRIPKRGFKNPNRVEYVPLNLSRLQEISEKLKTKELNLEMLVENGIVHKNARVKILAKGDLNDSLTVTAHAVSAKAKEAIEGKGGSVTLI
jgi:large subunit ribosomal protein L15